MIIMAKLQNGLKLSVKVTNNQDTMKNCISTPEFERKNQLGSPPASKSIDCLSKGQGITLTKYCKQCQAGQFPLLTLGLSPNLHSMSRLFSYSQDLKVAGFANKRNPL